MNQLINVNDVKWVSLKRQKNYVWRKTTVIIKGNYGHIGNGLGDILEKMCDTGNYNTAVNMKNELIWQMDFDK